MPITRSQKSNIGYAERNLGVIRRAYPGEYVAIVGRVIVDHDGNQANLADRVSLKFPGMRGLVLFDVEQRAAHI